LKALNDIHYVFVKSKADYRKDPVIVFVPSTPGCTVLESLFFESGPMRFFDDGRPIETNPHSWHDRASLLYLEAIAGAGYSEGADPALDDVTAVIEIRAALTLFFERFPEVRNNGFYLAARKNGASIITELAHDIKAANEEARAIDRVNLKGLIFLNPVMNADAETEYVKAEALAAHGFLEKTLVREFKDECLTNLTSEACVSVKEKVTRLIDQVNKYNFLKPCHINQNDGKCLSITHDKFAAFLSDTKVRDVFHVNHVTKQLQVCNSAIEKKYSRKPDKSEIFAALASSEAFDILMLSGDSDLIVPTLATQNWLRALFLTTLTEHPIREPTRRWSLINTNPKLQGRVAGTITHYGAGIKFVTVRGAGHFTGQDKAESVNYVINQFLRGSSPRS
jgi:hypothetical protein